MNGSPWSCKLDMLYLQGDAIAFVLGHHLGLRKKELLKLINDNSKGGSPAPDGAQVGSSFHCFSIPLINSFMVIATAYLQHPVAIK